MAFTIPDQAVWFTVFSLSLYFSFEASRFPLKVSAGANVAPGQVWWHLRAMVFPYLASILWYVMAAFSVAAGNNGTVLIYYFFTGLFFVYLVVGVAMTFYLAWRPIVEVLQGREKLENG